jgi:predicted ATP-grasp superfamily ATP-dependent carboligase
MITTITLFILLSALICAAEVHEKLMVALDDYIGRKPTPELQPAATKLLEFQVLKSRKSIALNADVAVAAEWAQLFKIYRNTGSAFYTTHFSNTPTLIEMFEDKSKWKTWMVSIGLGEHIPLHLPYNRKNSTEIEFPVILKTNWTAGADVHSGHGVHIVRDTEQLHHLVKQIAHHKGSFFLEESLTGMGLSEMSSFGSVFKGKLLSMRCMIRTFNADNIVKSKYNAAFNGSTSGPYIKGPTLKNDDDIPLPCGMDLVNVVSTMFSKSDYTGLYCTNWKLDRNMRPKMMEVNARFCGTLKSASGDALLLSTLVTLGYAALEVTRDDEAYQQRSALLHGPHKATFERIQSEEAHALATGGGWYQATWRDEKAFDMNKRLDPIAPTYGL